MSASKDMVSSPRKSGSATLVIENFSDYYTKEQYVDFKIEEVHLLRFTFRPRPTKPVINNFNDRFRVVLLSEFDSDNQVSMIFLSNLFNSTEFEFEMTTSVLNVKRDATLFSRSSLILIVFVVWDFLTFFS